MPSSSNLLSAAAAAALAENDLSQLSAALDAWRQDPATAKLCLEFLVYDSQGFPVLLPRRPKRDREMLAHMLKEIRWMIAYRHKTLAPSAGADAQGCHLLFTVRPDEWQTTVDAGNKPGDVSVWLVGQRQAGFPIARLGVAPAGLDPTKWANEAVTWWASEGLPSNSAGPLNYADLRFQLQVDLGSATSGPGLYETAAMRLRRRVRELWTATFEA